MKSFFSNIYSIIKTISNSKLKSDIQSTFNDSSVSLEEKNELKKLINVSENQPGISYSRLMNYYKNQSLLDGWNGLKFSFLFKPNQFFSIDYSLVKEKTKKLFKNIQTSATCFIPSIVDENDLNKNSSILLFGKKGPSSKFESQSQFIFGKDKFSISQQFSSDNIEQSIHSAEYSHDFDRMNVAFKFSNFDPLSISSVATIYKNLFVGIEAFKIPGEFSFGYNYSLFLKNGLRNRFGFSINYLSSLQSLFTDFSYKFNNIFTLYLNYEKYSNPLISKKKDYSANCNFNYNFIEANSSINKNANFHFDTTLNIFKNVWLLFNFGYDPKKITRKKTKITHLGFGIRIGSKSVEEGMLDIITNKNDKNIKEFSYENIAKANKI